MSIHIPVLLKESIEYLDLKQGDTVVDATLGGGGHSREILSHILPNGRLIAIDRDKKAIENYQLSIINFQNKGKIHLVHDNFSNIKDILADFKIDKVNAIIADFGISSDQLKDSSRGISFQTDAPLDMRMDMESAVRTAADIINQAPEEELVKILTEYGEERFARQIVREIIIRRKEKPITHTFELVDIISRAVPKKFQAKRINPATKTFQALRMAVNDELGHIRKFIPDAIVALAPKGRLAIIAFHSGEDRMVKEIFREHARGCVCPPEFPVCRCQHIPDIAILTKKPVIPEPEELAKNPRSRSAKLRVIEKL